MSTNDLNMEKDYQKLSSEIQQTIDRHNNTFKLIRSSDYSDSNSYESAFKDYKIDKEIEDVEEKRKEIWDVLTKKYNENTKMRKHFYDEMKNVDVQIMKQEEELEELIVLNQKLSSKNDKLSSELKSGKYNIDKYDYYMFMYKVLIVIQLIELLY